MQCASVLACVLVAVGACTPAEPPRFATRSPGCALEAWSALPARGFIELETFSLPSPASLSDVMLRLRASACRDGADAIYAPKAGRMYVYAIALKWTDAVTLPPPRSHRGQRTEARGGRTRVFAAALARIDAVLRTFATNASTSTRRVCSLRRAGANVWQWRPR
jgi:hypothetical protein